MNGKPLLLGHRGCRGRSSAVLPVENSLAAFEYALTNGCDGFEFDVRHTRDGRNVLWHDPKWQGMEIAATDYADLTDRNGACPPALEEALQRFGSRAYLDIELKASRQRAQRDCRSECAPPQKLDLSSRRSIPKYLPSCTNWTLRCPWDSSATVTEQWLFGERCQFAFFLPQDAYVQPSLIDEVHARGQQIMTWTVNDARRMRELAEWGIDGIISDDPRLLYQTFHSG